MLRMTNAWYWEWWLEEEVPLARISQQPNIELYRFTTMGTFEEKIDAMLRSKKELATLAVSTGEK
jgi:SNF2 family DNA or RNA helicase